MTARANTRMREQTRMSQQEAPRDGVFINVRKLAALDIVFHGSVLIVAEFALTTLIAAGLAALLFTLSLARGPVHPWYQIVAGAYFLAIALNYLPLLLYALDIARRKNAHAEAAHELAHGDVVKRKYGLQSLLLFLPLIVPVLALAQELSQRRQRAGTQRNAGPTVE